MTISKSATDYKYVENLEKDRCSNCGKLFNDSSGVLKKGSKISWYNQLTLEEKQMEIVEAVIVIFEGLLEMNKSQFSPREDISMCYDCLFNVSELYKNYREFMGRSITTSFFRKLFPKCILWSTDIQKAVGERCSPKKTSAENKSISSQRKQRDVMKTENIWDNDAESLSNISEELFDDEQEIKKESIGECEDYDDFDFGVEVEMDSEISRGASSPNTDNLLVMENIQDSNISLEIGRPHLKIARDSNINVVQLPNGKWFVPKTANVLLSRYIPGNPLSLDIGKEGKELLSKRIKLNNGDTLRVPSSRKLLYIYQQRSGSEKMSDSFEKRCQTCEQVFTDKILYTKHLKDHPEKQKDNKNKYACKECGKQLQTKKQLWYHRKTVHTPKGDYACITCGKCFPFNHALKSHITTVHLDSKEERLRKSRLREERKRANPNRRLRKKNKKWLEIHPDKVEEVTCGICGKILASPHMKNYHVLMLHKPESERPFGCRFCERRFPTEGLKDVHERKHLGTDRTHICETCGNSFTSAGVLRKHKTRVHSEHPPCICEQCGKSVKNPETLRKHMIGVHQITERAHECDICNSKFKTKEAVQSHKKAMHTHTQEERCLCLECGISLKNKRVLQRHMTNSHGVNAESTCSICQRGFSKISDYEEHMAKGYHIKPLWMRPESERKKRNYNVPSFLRPRLQRKVDRESKRRERDGLPPFSESEKEEYITKGMEQLLESGESFPARKRTQTSDHYFNL